MLKINSVHTPLVTLFALLTFMARDFDIAIDVSIG
ncbi:uncharacterized protein METZ01_LOCUS315503, partial [marine metagenome]